MIQQQRSDDKLARLSFLPVTRQ